MKFVGMFISIFFVLSFNVCAETKYVSENLAVMVRTGPNIERRIIGMPLSGTPLEVLETNEDGWSRVRLSNDNEGWLLSRYLVPGPPRTVVIDQLRKENSILTGQVNELTRENTELKAERNRLENAYKTQKNSADNLNEAYETLKSESTEYLKVKAVYEKAQQQLNTKTQQLQTLEMVVQNLRKDQSLWWLIAGSSAVLLGFIIGYVSRRPKRSSYLR